MKYNRIILGKIIKMNRNKAGYSQEVLSGLIGISRSHLSLIETGSTSITLDLLCEISYALNVPLSSIIADIEEIIRN